LEESPKKVVVIEDKPNQRMKIFYNLEGQSEVFERHYSTNLFEQIITTQSYIEGVTCDTHRIKVKDVFKDSDEIKDLDKFTFTKL